MGIGRVLTMPLFFASNAIYPLAIMPAWLQVIARLNPLSYEADALRALMITGGTTSFGLAIVFAVITGTSLLLVLVPLASSDIGSGLPPLLIRPNQLRLADDVTLHCRFELRLGGLVEIGQLHVQRVKLVEVAMAADGGAWTAVAGVLKIVLALARPGRKFSRLAFTERVRVGGQIIDDPVDPGHLRRIRIRRVGVVDDQHETLGRRGFAAPYEWRRHVVAFTRVLARDLSVRFERGRLNRQRHERLLPQPGVGMWRRVDGDQQRDAEWVTVTHGQFIPHIWPVCAGHSAISSTMSSPYR
jgi:ABC-2 family transporter